jgi:uncharacterized RDD family membrane protein YckC
MSEIIIETSNNVEINLNAASLSHRILAYLIDILLIIVYSIFFWITFTIIESSIDQAWWTPLLVVVAFVLPLLLYHLLMEFFNNGQSVGKMVMKIKVVKLDGSQPSLGNYLLRWLLRPIDLFFYGSVAILTIILSKAHQRLGDMAAGTIVVQNKPKVTLDELSAFLNDDSYIPVYQNANLLSQAQINVIKDALFKYQTSVDSSLLMDLAPKVKSLLNIENNSPEYKFLYTIVKDFENLNSR